MLCYIARGRPKRSVVNIEDFTNSESNILYFTQQWNLEEAKDAQNMSNVLLVPFLAEQASNTFS